MVKTKHPKFKLEQEKVVSLVLDIWRIYNRARRQENITSSVVNACERAMETLEDIGFTVREMVDEPYNDNMVVKIIERQGGNSDLRISECISPAIYYQGELMNQAIVVIKGEDKNEKSNG